MLDLSFPSLIPLRRKLREMIGEERDEAVVAKLLDVQNMLEAHLWLAGFIIGCIFLTNATLIVYLLTLVRDTCR